MEKVTWPRKHVRLRGTYHMNGDKMVALEWKVGLFGRWVLEGLFDPTNPEEMKNLERRKLRLERGKPQ